MEKEVNLYVTPKSADTQKIKDFLEERGVDVKVRDIHADVKAHKEMLEATRGACGAPVVEIGHQIVCGFDSARLEETLKFEFK